ncbi:lipoprotein [Microbulbifer sp. SAOS-129_SWC]|uniref:LPS translocon maturation chaperone LptM n=1 Tax=Microbulbifer sp. SAOS-129_SWC TaxID=3145235 RepID=UPI003217DBDD
MSKKRLLSLAVFAVLPALLNACGQKGPLYLPQDAAQPAPPTAATAPVATAPAATAPAATAEEQTEQKQKQKHSAAAGGEAEIEK